MRICVLVMLILGIGLAAGGADQPVAPDKADFAIRTVPLEPDLAGARTIRLDGKLGGAARLWLDTNESTLDEIGNEGEKTRKAITPIDVQIKALDRQPNPAAVLYDIVGVPKARLRLAVLANGVYRILELDEQRSPTRVVTAEPSP